MIRSKLSLMPALFIALTGVTPAQVSPDLVKHLQKAKDAASHAHVSGKIMLLGDSVPDGRMGRAEYQWAFAAGREHETMLTGLNQYEAVWDGKQGTLRTRTDDSAPWTVTSYEFNQSAVSPIRDGYFATLGGGTMRQSWVLDVARTPGAVSKATPDGRVRVYTSSADGSLNQFVELSPDWGYMIDRRRDVILAAPDPVTGKPKEVSQRNLRVLAARSYNGCWIPTSVEIQVVRRLTSGATLQSLTRHQLFDSSPRVRNGEFRILFQPGDLVRRNGETLRVVGSDGRLHPIPTPTNSGRAILPRVLVCVGLAGAGFVAVQIARGSRRARRTAGGYWGPPN